MKRIKGFEWEDQPWFPSFLRRCMTDFLRFILQTGNLYKPVTPLLIAGLQHTNSSRIIDLCSGAGGAVPGIQQNIKQATGKTIPFILTDLYPNTAAYRQIEQDTNGSIMYSSQAVNATHVPDSLHGFRTIFSGFHHFDENTAKKVLLNATDANEGIAVFDGGSRSVWFIILILIFHPPAFMLGTPFIKPFSVKRLLFTYLLPVVPLCTIWDGIVSVMRLYTPDELLLLATQTTKNKPYIWQSGIIANRAGIRIAYLIGYPATTALPS